jgi:hypothetical protein
MAATLVALAPTRLIRTGWVIARTVLCAIVVLSASTVSAQTNDAAFLWWTGAPTTMQPGQTAIVTVSMQNTGDTAWTRFDDADAQGYHLGTQNGQDNTWWGTNRWYLPVGTSVGPWESYDFTFQITAPLDPGSYNLQFRMLQEDIAWFGDYTSNETITVAVPAVDAAFGAAFLGQNVPSVMTTGSTATVSVTMLNTGNTTWTDPDNYFLGAQNPENNVDWGLNRVRLGTVPPGAAATFTFEIQAPASPTTRSFQWRMLKENVAWFGDYTPNVDISIVGPTATDSARFVAESGIPFNMAPGGTASISVTMENTGTTTWTNGTYNLGTQDGMDNVDWGFNRVGLGGGSVPPGQSHTFTVTITAPNNLTTPHLQFQMVHESVAWFGELTPDHVIQVAGSITALGNCQAADPNDSIADDAALNSCLANNTTVTLYAGTPGYIISDTLIVHTNNVLTSDAASAPATIIASAGLNHTLLDATSATNVTLSRLVIDGNRDGRRALLNGCSGDSRTWGYNVRLRNTFYVDGVTSRNALCGSAMEVDGSDFTIKNSHFENNGFAENDPTLSFFPTFAPWSDGLTLLRCDRGEVYDNYFFDNTDVDLISGGGNSCRAHDNHITHSYRYGQGGLVIFGFVNSGYTHPGSEYSFNDVTSAPNQLAFGIEVGTDPWLTPTEEDTERLQDAGSVHHNTSTGAVVNVAINGLLSGSIVANAASNPQGTNAFGPIAFSANYIACRWGNATIQPGYDVREFSNGSLATTCSGTTVATPPSPTITAPTGGVTYTSPASITVTANATPATGTITKVEFFANSTLIATDTASPYSATWSSVTPGTYTITARATESTGATAMSAGVVVGVNSATAHPPTVNMTAPLSFRK